MSIELFLDYPIELRAVATAVISVLDHLASSQPVLVAVDDLVVATLHAVESGTLLAD